MDDRDFKRGGTPVEDDGEDAATARHKTWKAVLEEADKETRDLADRHAFYPPADDVRDLIARHPPLKALHDRYRQRLTERAEYKQGGTPDPATQTISDWKWRPLEQVQSDLVVVVNQRDDSRRFDEHKCMLGFPSEKAAVECYVRGFSDGRGRDRIASVESMSVAAFKDWLKRGRTKQKANGTDIVRQALKIVAQPRA